MVFEDAGMVCRRLLLRAGGEFLFCHECTMVAILGMADVLRAIWWLESGVRIGVGRDLGKFLVWC
jgi:hypothetical protein